MRAGRMRHRLVVKAPGTTIGSDGAPVESATTVTTRWAERVSAQGREFERALQVNADVTHVWRMRPVSGLTPVHYLLEGSERYDVLSVEPGNVADEILVTTKRKV